MAKTSKNTNRLQRKRRIRAKVFGTVQRPRLCVFRSLRNISAQAIDDQNGNTLAAANLAEVGKNVKNGVEGAKEVGKLIAGKCIAAGIKTVTFDRSGYKYHGKVKAVAEGAREGGLEF